MRIAAPMRGPPLATERPDMLLSMFRWAYGRDRAGARELRGLTVLRPDEPLLA